MRPPITERQRPRSERNDRDPREVAEYLYRQGQTMLKKKKLRAELADQQMQYLMVQGRSFSVSHRSQMLYERKLRQKLLQIFQAFEVDNKGFISASEVGLENVPAEVLLIFKPLLVEMETFEEQLDQQEFIESSLVLMQRCTVSERATVLNFGQKKKLATEQYPYAPSINRNSSRLATKIHKKLKKEFEQSLANPVKRFEVHKEISQKKRAILLNKVKQSEQ